MKTSRIYFFGALGGLLFGYNTGIISGALHFIGEDLKVTENSLLEGFLTASILIGAIFGAFTIGKFADNIGRKPSLYGSSLIFVIGALVCSFSGDINVLIIGRVISGFAVGSVSCIVPMYLSELAPAKRRGSIAFMNQFMIVLGILISYIANYIFMLVGNTEWNVHFGWRIIIAFALIPSVLLFFGVFTLPESPRFLLLVGDTTAAENVLLKLRPASDVQSEINEIKSSITAKSGRVKDLFSKYARPSLIAAVGLAIFQQFSGINTLIYYTPKVLEIAGLDSQMQRLATVGVGAMNVIATVIAILIVDQVNRRTLLTIGGLVMAFSLIALAIIESSGFIQNEPLAAGLYSTLILMVYMLAFGITWGGIMWIVLAEVFPLHIRGVGVGFASSINWISNFTVILLFPWLLGHAPDEPDCYSECGTQTMLGGSPFYLYIAMCVFALLGVFFVRTKLFETRGKSLEEIESDLDAKALGVND